MSGVSPRTVCVDMQTCVVCLHSACLCLRSAVFAHLNCSPVVSGMLLIATVNGTDLMGDVNGD